MSYKYITTAFFLQQLLTHVLGLGKTGLICPDQTIRKNQDGKMTHFQSFYHGFSILINEKQMRPEQSKHMFFLNRCYGQVAIFEVQPRCLTSHDLPTLI